MRRTARLAIHRDERGQEQQPENRPWTRSGSGGAASNLIKVRTRSGAATRESPLDAKRERRALPAT